MRAHILALAVLLVFGIAALPGTPGTGGAAEAGWFHVTFDAAVTQADRDAVDAAGGDAVMAMGGSTYVAWFDRAPAVAGAKVRVRTASEKRDDYLASSGVLHVVALVHSSASDGLAGRLVGAGTVDALRPDAVPGVVAAYVTSSAEGLETLTDDPAVLYVGPASTGLAPDNERSAQIVAGKINASPGYEGWLDDVGVTGEGVNVTIVDSGIDPRHPDLGPAIVGKVERSQSPTGVPADDGGHGSHVAGIVAGRGLGLSTTGQRARPTESGYLQGLGVAPGAGLVDQNMLANTAAGPLCGGTWPPSDWEPLTADALALDSHIWNASWQSCEGTGAGYIRSASEMDRLTRDGDSATAGPQPFTMVFSAGNSGAGSNPNDTRLTAPKEAKNTIVVASLDVGSPNTISLFSSRGPARDGRIVPTVAAPGGGVLSTRSTTATASCNTPTTIGLPEGLLYASCSGTSMAAPHVAGAVALITEWWRGANDDADPSPAMAKALLVNSAADMGVADIPNRHEGWGRVDLGRLFDADADRTYLDEQVLLTDPGEEYTTQVEVDGAAPFRVTLVWTDRPGVPGASPALVNDLDLVLTSPDGTTYRGNNFAAGQSLAGGVADRINNTENVFVTAPVAGTWTVTVHAAALPGDGDPFAGDLTDQDFALVTSG